MHVSFRHIHTAMKPGFLSYNESQRDALFLKFIFDKELYVFWTDLLSIIRSLNTVYAAIGICHASYAECPDRRHK
jgi:hypothetical protein